MQQFYLGQWQTLLHVGADAALIVATEDFQRAAALRHCSPFCGALSNAERFDFLRSWRGRRTGWRSNTSSTPPRPSRTGSGAEERRVFLVRCVADVDREAAAG